MSPDRQKLYLLRPTLADGGGDRVTLTLLRELDRSRFDVSLVLMRRAGVLLPQVPDHVRVIDLGGRSLWTAWWPLARLLRRRPPEILFSTSSGANIAALVADLLSPRRYRLLISERTVLFRQERGPKRLALFALKRLLYARADEITVVSEGLRRDLATRLGLPAERLRVVSNPIVTAELERLAAEPVDDPWLGGEHPVLLAAGRLIPQKDFTTLLRAFAIVRRRHPARLIILGEGPLRDRLQRLAIDLGAGQDVRLPGFEPNPFRFMSRCDLFVLSSAFEGMPGVLIQAMACGAAVIATDCPTGPSEVVRSGRDGILVPVGDPEAMAGRILDLLEDPGLRRRLGARAPAAVARFASTPALSSYTAAILGQPQATEGAP